MPLEKLKDRLKKLCDLHGIRFQKTEESYTSKAWHVPRKEPLLQATLSAESQP